MADKYNLLKAPFSRCLARFEAIDRNFQLAKYGIQELSKSNLDNGTGILNPWHYSIYSGFQLDSQIGGNPPKEKLLQELNDEIEKHFPRLSASAAVARWSAIEILARDFAPLWIELYPGKVEVKQGQEISVNAGDLLFFETNKNNARWALCRDIMRQSKGDTFLDRFDFLQRRIGLASPETPKALKKTLTELEAVRHIIVHKDSLVDDAFKRRCPNPKEVPEKVGDLFEVNQSRHYRYHRAGLDYVGLLMDRVRNAVPQDVCF